MADRIISHQGLKVYQRAFETATRIFDLTRKFPREETYSLTDQIRRSSRSVCANLAEAWRKRRYRAAFTARLCDVEGEAAETQVWINFAVQCGYLPADEGRLLHEAYESILATLVGMINHPESWVIGDRSSH